jgi:hypothetical protein
METTPVETPPAELIVHNGRKHGTRRSLKNPVTIIGSTQGCDIRLDVPNVRPIHCLIALGRDGPHLRSWGPDDTLVNAEAVQTHLLEDGDLLRIGPFEFKVHCPIPEAAPVAAEPLAEAVAPPLPSAAAGADELPRTAAAEPVTDTKIQRLEELQRDLREARSLFRHERKVHEADLDQRQSALADAQSDLERREGEVREQRERLLALRSRFIKRWKRHWSAQRHELTLDLEQLADERGRFDAGRTALVEERERFEARRAVEGRRLEHGWEELQAAERQARDERARLAAALDQREQAIADGEARLRAEQLALRAEQMRLEHHSADLRIEADGMESRVVNLRAVLLQLDQRRGGAVANTPPSALQPEVPAPQLEQAAYEKLAEELADQRFALIEQFERLEAARQAWRDEETRLVGEMADLAEQLRRREEQIAENEVAGTFAREQLDRDAAALKQLQDGLEVRKSRQDSIEARWRSELSRREVDVQRRRRDLERREEALSEMCRRWRERRRREVAGMRDDHVRCEKIVRAWAQQMGGCEQRELAVERRQIDLAARALVLETARQQLFDGNGDRELAAKKLERLERHARTALAKAEARIEKRWQAGTAERAALTALLERAQEQIEAAAVKQRDAADLHTDLERREYFVSQQALRLSEIEAGWSTQRHMLERECADLGREIDRLASIIIEAAPPGLHRAA